MRQLTSHRSDTKATDRKELEAAFHDHLREELPWQRYSVAAEQSVQDDPNWSNFKLYSIERRSRAYTDRWILERCRGKQVLDYACGNGDDAILAATNGASAIGIDISPVSVENAKRKAISAGVGDKTAFHVMDAEDLLFPDKTFDLIVIYGVLHHLDFDRAMAQIRRVLKPDGAVICTEALGHNPLIRWYRKRTPHLRTSWEVDHILTKPTIATAARFFDRVECRFYHLATIAAVPFRRTKAFPAVLKSFELVDAALLRLPFVKWQAWQAIIELSQPKAI